jgi:hypothetical protein
MVTLSKEPPTLDRDSTKHKYTKTFKEMIDMCLQKDPTKRCLYLTRRVLFSLYWCYRLKFIIYLIIVVF